jgi:hypothetical protein
MKADARGRHPWRRRFGQTMALPRRSIGQGGRPAGVQGTLSGLGTGTTGAGRYTLLWPLAGAALAAVLLLGWLAQT